MSLNLFSLALVLTAARGLYAILRPVTQRARLYFWAATVLCSMGTFLLLLHPYTPLDVREVAVWALAGLAGWYCPELFQSAIASLRNVPGRLSHVPPVQLLLWVAGVVSVIVMLVLPETMGSLGALWCAGIAINILLKKSFRSMSAPRKKSRKRH